MNMMLSKFSFPLAVLLAVWLDSPAAATARGAKSRAAAGGQRAQVEKHMGKVAQELNLTADQKRQLKPTLQEEAQKVKALRADTGLSQQQKRQKLQEIRQDLLAKIKSILTPEQLAKWQQLRGEKHAKRAHKS
jgi:periplasmic protein CpxP/Spy